jgi:methylenetetrahydrofolate reductase (NADPH)
MKFAEAYRPGRFGLSFELFPPKSAEAETQLFAHVAELMKFRPDYVTCTYGAGGSTRQKTLEIVSRVRQEFGCPVASHLTCVGSTVDELCRYLAAASAANIDSIVALRGDPPKGTASFTPVAGGLRYANELVQLIRREFPEFGIAVAGYPETHQEAQSPQADLENLRRKVDAGADVVITQLFYDNTVYASFRARCEAAGIRAPIVPGILPVTNLAQVQRIAALCKARLPDDFARALAAHPDGSPEQFEIGVEFATAQLHDLIARGAPGAHFYVLNKSQAARRVLASVRGG